MWPKLCWRTQLLIEVQPCVLQTPPNREPAVTQLHANSPKPHTELLSFWVLFMAQAFISERKRKKLLVQKPTPSVGTFCEKMAIFASQHKHYS